MEGVKVSSSKFGKSNGMKSAVLLLAGFLATTLFIAFLTLQSYAADPVTVTSSTELQSVIDAAVDGEEQIILLGDSFSVDETINITSGKVITIKDDGTARTITRSVPLFNVEGTLTLDASSDDALVITGSGTDFERGNIVTVHGNDAVLEVKGGTYEVGTLVQQVGGGIVIDEGAVFNMYGGIIKDAVVDRLSGNQIFFVSSAVLISKDGGTFNMYDGEITGCSTSYPGHSRPINPVVSGYFVTEANYGEATINMFGGRIHGNSGGASSAVFVGGSTQAFNMYGGIIENNDASQAYNNASFGATVRVTNGATFTLDGGTIRNNNALRGGGVYLLGTDNVNLISGLIEGNYAEYFGGGIFINPYDSDTEPRYVSLNKTAVYGNTALIQGGGIYSCPTGGTDFHATDGIAVFDNTAHSERFYNAGDDYSNIGSDKQTMSISMSERMLGGGLVTYYNDGAVYDSGSETGAVDRDAPRYDPDNPGDPVNPSGLTNSYALKVITTDDAKAAAKDAASLTIRNNTARRGGGIALNVNLTSGEDTDLWKVEVEKKWADTIDVDMMPVLVNLMRDGYVLDTVTLSKDNNWRAEFTELPDPDTLDDVYTVVEEDNPDFAITYDKTVSDKTTAYTITNRKKNRRPEIVKTIEGTDNLKLEKLDEKFAYKIVTRFPDDATAFRIEDELDEALCFVDTQETVVSIDGIEFTEAEHETQLTQSDNKFVLTFTPEQIAEHAGKEISIVFKARLADGADLSKYKDNKVPNVACYVVDNEYYEYTEEEGATLEVLGAYESADDEDSGNVDNNEDKQEDTVDDKENNEPVKEDKVDIKSKQVDTGDRGFGRYVAMFTIAAAVLMYAIRRARTEKNP